MATDTSTPRAAHIRGVTVTTIAALAGVVAAVVSSIVTVGASSPSTSRLGLYVLVAAILIQLPVLQVLGKAGLVAVDVDDFSAKDYLYVSFMTFSLWFLCWAVLLTTGTTF